MTSNVYTKEQIVNLLQTSNAAVERALVVLYARQTADEQVAQTTSHQNGVGFNGVDAEILSSFAQQIEKKLGRGVKLGQCLSQKQMEIARKKVQRYSRQLVEAANEKAASQAQPVVKAEIATPCQTQDEVTFQETSRYALVTVDGKEHEITYPAAFKIFHDYTMSLYNAGLSVEGMTPFHKAPEGTSWQVTPDLLLLILPTVEKAKAEAQGLPKEVEKLRAKVAAWQSR